MPISYPLVYPQLKFSIDDVSVILKNDEIISYRRDDQKFLEVSRSHNGSILVAGNNYLSPQEWQLTLKLEDELYDLLSSIFTISSYKAYKPPRLGFEIFIDDICKPMLEYVPSLDRVSEVTEWGEIIGGSTKYFARFKSVFTNFTAAPNGTGYDVDLTAIQV